MRRKEREINDLKAVESIISSSKVCRLALSDGDQPYIVPLCFGYRDNALYFHSAVEGKKMEIIRKNPNVCFEFEKDVDLIRADIPCGWGMKYQSVIGFGRASVIDETDDKMDAVKIIMSQYSDHEFEFNRDSLNKILIIKVEISEMTGKKSG
ncbi:MAG: pyridoxamine 5'-phosphate oxidase family protein [Deltaproteobacteria bacterium]|nr:pyridoxamine 5'-phosphate oxidase family protein [Deltaproteobacteria bacterium]